MSTLSVSVGRNVGQEPLSDNEWWAFKQAIVMIADVYGQMVFEGEGTGIDSVTGELEDAYTVIFHSVRWPDEGLESNLRTAARRYGQQEVAVLVTDGTHFIHADVVAA